ncbi:sulfite exporter TauE/SafE family protein 3-like isoform X2 [Euphorbia lathyris]|uniref:sulfite exporter TauE/SafE family protein 3-like isoform X2 n=1 Tax=Euphorbia lathyris TaxID=212925 RepID=UPI0033131BBD
MIPRDFINILVLASLFIVAVADTQLTSTHNHTSQSHYGNRLHSPSKHVWPEMKFGWKLVMGTITGFIGAAFGSAAGIGGGGIFVPMLKLIIGFDAKSSIAISKFMSTKAFLRAIKTWNKETEAKKMEDAARCLESKFEVVVSKSSSEILSNKAKISVIENVYWKGVGLLFGVWFIILALQITKNYTKTCSVQYWILDFAQVPITSGLAIYETFRIYKGKRKISSKGEAGSNLSVPKLTFYCLCGLFAGIAGGLLGLGGGFILGPLFLEMGIPPQVSSATATFAMTFSASMSVVEYYLLKRIPIPYALYLFGVAIVAGIVGQYVVKKVIDMLGRASIIIFILSLTILISAIALGGVGIADMITDIEHKEYMGFENMCSLS